MLKFLSVTASNFLSIGQQPVSVDLDTKNLRCILGNNEDIGEKGASANGVGKTTIFNAIVFGLFGKGIDKLKTDEFINIVNGKKLVVELNIEKNGVKYKIRRGRKPNFVELADENGVSLTLDAMRNTDDSIVDLIGYDYNTFMASVFLSPHRQSFMAMSGPEQRAMIEQMLSLDVLALRAEQLKKMRSDVQVDLKVLERDIANAIRSNEQAEETKQRLLTKACAFEQDRRNKINDIEKMLDSLGEIDESMLLEMFSDIAEAEQTITANEGLLKTLNEEISNLRSKKEDNERKKKWVETLTTKSRDFDKKQEDRLRESHAVLKNKPSLDILREMLVAAEKAEDLKRQQREDSKTRVVLSHSYKRASDELAERTESLEAHLSGKCPVCSSEYVNDEAVAKIRDRIAEIEGVFADLSEKIAKIDEKYANYDEHNSSSPSSAQIKDDIADVTMAQKAIENEANNPFLDELIEERAKLLHPDEEHVVANKLAAKFEEAAKLSDKIDEEKQDIVLLRNEMYQTYHVSNVEDIARIGEEIVKKKDERYKISMEDNPFNDEIEHVKAGIVSIAPFMDKVDELRKKETHIGYLVKLMTDSKSFIRRRILDNYIPYLNKKINEYAERLGLPHVCEVSSDLSVSMTYMNKEVSYFNLSRGERLRLDMATTVAFRDMMGMLGKGCNIALLDEVLDSALDASGIHAAMKFICQSAETVLLITHREELSSSVDEKIYVTKRNGFTLIE